MELTNEQKSFRNAAIEDAAKLADEYGSEVQSGHWLTAAQEIARRIRSLKSNVPVNGTF